MVTKLVSIIMPAYNAEKTIQSAVDSVINQTYRNWELIIIDDGSSDNTFKIITEYAITDKRIQVYKNKKNLKVAKTRNRGFSIARGDYIAFLDSDDMWTVDKIEKQLGFMLNNNIDFSFANTIIIKEKKQNKELIFEDNVDFKKLLKSNQISCLTVMLNSKLLKNLKMKDIGHEDYLLWLEILKKYEISAYNTNETLGYYRESDDSLSGNKLKAAKWQWKIYREELKLALFPSFFYFANYALKGIIKKI